MKNRLLEGDVTIGLAIFSVLALVILFFLWKIGNTHKLRRKIADDDANIRQAQLSASIEQAKKRLSGYKNITFAEFNHMKVVLAISEDESSIAVHMLPSNRDSADEDLNLYPIVNIQSVSLSQKITKASVSKVKMKWMTEKREVRKSADGHALVGGILPGPVGAIAGAASGPNGNKTIQTGGYRLHGYQAQGAQISNEFVSLVLDNGDTHQIATDNLTSTRALEASLRSLVARHQTNLTGLN